MNEILSPKQRQCALMLASGKTARQTAKDVKVAYQTISKWRHIRAFRQLIDDTLKDMESESSLLLKGLRVRAVERLGGLLDSTSDTVALKACETILGRMGPPPQHRTLESEEESAPLDQLFQDVIQSCMGGEAGQQVAP